MHPNSPLSPRHSQHIILCPLSCPSGGHVGMLTDLTDLISHRLAQVTVAAVSSWVRGPHHVRRWYLILLFLILQLLHSLSVGRGSWYSYPFGDPAFVLSTWASALAADHFRERLCWLRLRAALTYGHKHEYPEGGLTTIPVSKTTESSSLGLNPL